MPEPDPNPYTSDKLGPGLRSTPPPCAHRTRFKYADLAGGEPRPKCMACEVDELREQVRRLTAALRNIIDCVETGDTAVIVREAQEALNV